ncbi:MAG: CRISPR-associated ring nuclease [Verrucomicrobiae bacterium]|nr:CRISPR-associated ring nuclease [Verrucomicrobiae bacterium]
MSLGVSPAVVPEAFLLPDVEFGAVHVLTTETTDISLVDAFFAQHAPGVTLQISRVEGFKDLENEKDHFNFEELLYRWVLDTGVPARQRYFCLSGGFKTMSAAMQKAAAVLGAAEVFHVLADTKPTTIEEIREAHRLDQLRWIRLGAEDGWPQFRTAHRDEFPLLISKQQGRVRWIRAPDHSFLNRLREIVQRSHNIAGAWGRLSDLPFPALATWPQHALDWLDQPVDPLRDRSWVAALPKIELHCHLGGFATHGDLLHQVRAAAEHPRHLPPLNDCSPPPDWPLPRQPVSLTEYTRLGDNTGSAILADPGCLRRQCELLYRHLTEQNVVYAEIRCSPANYARNDRSPWQVLSDIRAQFQHQMDRARQAGLPACHVNLILIATRRARGDYRANIARHLSLAVAAAEHWYADDDCRVVGVDLAGYEDPATRAHYFREEFTAVHRCGLAVTVHAGENDDVEAIWRAVFDLNARRLGHALHLVDSPELLRSVAQRGIAVEMCPYANYQIRGYRLEPDASDNRPRYPLLDYLRAGVRVTVNTDNIGISAASLTDNLLLAARLCPGMTRLDLLRLQRHALEAAFISPTHRAALVQQLTERLPIP